MTNLEILNSIIGFSIVIILFMYANFLVTKPEYQKLVKATENLIGCINYSVNCWLRKLQVSYQI